MTIKLRPNPRVNRSAKNLPARFGITVNRFRAARDYLTRLPDYQVTPLLDLPQLARTTRVAALYFKDESSRLKMPSFKALGGEWGVAQALRALAPKQRANASTPSPQRTICCATDGNHGLAVARAAQRMLCAAVIFIPDVCSLRRAQRIQAAGATVQRVRGTYEDAHRAAIRASEANDWILVSDTAFAGYRKIPLAIMHAYQLTMHEVVYQMRNEPSLTHIFVQAGTGGLAAAVCSFFWRRHGNRRPRLVVVEAQPAACFFASAEAGRPVAIPGPHPTKMTGLACGEASTLAYAIIDRGADYFITVEDDDLVGVRQLLRPHIRWRSRGASGIAGLAAFVSVAGDEIQRRCIGLTQQSRVLMLGTE